ncbi:beta-L-arabinofuranosidase domain-containing protein [Pseudarthrobacter phenanthrenivorans]|uniref:glycoside hydrolase family 127 protein n=1 Tax=Pseudarthrobacter phenanthrenivorans TaxID=361575 RepID=UPI00344BAB01
MTSETLTQRAFKPLPLTAVRIEDDFWAPRREMVRTRTLRQQEQQLRKPGQQFDALKLGWKPGDPEPHIFWESDVAKWIEAASYCLAQTDDPELEASVDEAIELLAGAQQPDGYLNVYFTVVRPGERFTDLRDAHELYCAGHLIEAGVAHYEATGKTRLLEVVRRYADLIDRTFGPGGECEGGYDGHQEIELALVKLHRATADRRYLELSRRLIGNRGQQPFYFDIERERRGTEGYFSQVFPERPMKTQRFREYNQSHQPVIEQNEAVGHSVRAVYMYSAMTDLAEAYQDQDLASACDRLWDNLTGKKMYLTGGIGSDHTIEGFGPNYDLPDEYAYAETCAAIGLVQWSQRMANTRGDGRYVDVLERALYNGVLSGASADGTHYFYGNPLASNGTVHRHEWFGVACCPPNLARLLSELGRYAYSEGINEARVNLFIGSRAEFTLANGNVTVQQQTDFPRTGNVKLTVNPHGEEAAFTLSVRVPDWSGNFAATLNGKPLGVSGGLKDGYFRIDRTWAEGDTLGIDLGLAPNRVYAHPQVASASGKAALQWGPLVFCVEGVDHDAPVRGIVLSRNTELTAQDDDRTGTVTLHAAATTPRHREGLYTSSAPKTRETNITAVPYFSWANRGQTDMTVWIHETP